MQWLQILLNIPEPSHKKEPCSFFKKKKKMRQRMDRPMEEIEGGKLRVTNIFTVEFISVKQVQEAGIIQQAKTIGLGDQTNLVHMTAVSLPTCMIVGQLFIIPQLCRNDSKRSTWYIDMLNNCEVPLFLPPNILLLSPLNMFVVLAIKCRIKWN